MEKFLQRIFSGGKWAGISKSKRRENMEKCGEKCYLLATQLKFPVCDANCKYSKQGLEAAYKRAREWGYNSVAAKAKSLMNK